MTVAYPIKVPNYENNKQLVYNGNTNLGL